MPKTTDFRLRIFASVRDGEDRITAEIEPTPADNCRATGVRVDGQLVAKNTKKIGIVSVNELGAANTSVKLRAPQGHPPVKIEIEVDCKGGDKKTFTAIVPSERERTDAESATTNVLDAILNFFKGIADTLGEEFKKLLPGELRDGLKKIKGLVGKGLDLVSNLLPGLKLIPNPTSPLLLLLPDNLEHLKKKIGEHLKDLDPLDDSPEAALADAEALRALILEDIIPYVQQVGEVATNDLKQYTQRLSVMQKMTSRLNDQIKTIQPAGKAKRKTVKKK